MIDPHSGVPAHRQLAELLRARTASGEFPAGSLLPAAPRLRHEYGVGKATVQKALDTLRAEGLIELDRGIGMRVREPVERRRVSVPRGSLVRARMPTPQERADLDVPEGVPVLIVVLGGRERGPYPADRTDLTFS